jgi:pimeloyl-ACP methyl ester carboxylesterase
MQPLVIPLLFPFLLSCQAQNWPNLLDSPKAFAGIGSLRMPVLVIHGDKDLPYINETSLYLEGAIPGAKRVVLKGAAHMINLERLEEVNWLLLEFLQQKN